MANKQADLIIFTDLDGTLLDTETYEWKEAQPALDACSLHNIPVVLVSSKTRAEMEVIRKQLGLKDPYISENGGGIFFPLETPLSPPPEAVITGNIRKLDLGEPYSHLVRCLRHIMKGLGWKFKGFSDMDPVEISKETSLDPNAAKLAAMREFDEPFRILAPESPDPESLHEAAKEMGLKVSEGGRFFHLHGQYDKGDAIDKLISWYEGFHSDIITIALGDSPNDFNMMKQVDLPVLVKSFRDFPELKKELPGLLTTKEPGPKGWNEAILKILDQQSEGGNSGYA